MMTPLEADIVPPSAMCLPALVEPAPINLKHIKTCYDLDALGMDEEVASLTLPSKPSETILQTMCKLIKFV